MYQTLPNRVPPTRAQPAPRPPHHAAPPTSAPKRQNHHQTTLDGAVLCGPPFLTTTTSAVCQTSDETWSMQRRPSEYRPKHGPVERLTDKADAAKPYSLADRHRTTRRQTPPFLSPPSASPPPPPNRPSRLPGRLDAWTRRGEHVLPAVAVVDKNACMQAAVESETPSPRRRRRCLV